MGNSYVLLTHTLIIIEQERKSIHLFAIGPIHSRRGQQNLTAGLIQPPRASLKRPPFCPAPLSMPIGMHARRLPLQGRPLWAPKPVCTETLLQSATPTPPSRPSPLFPRSTPAVLPATHPQIKSHPPNPCPDRFPGPKSPFRQDLPSSQQPETRPPPGLRHHDAAFVRLSGYNHRHGRPALASRLIDQRLVALERSFPFDSEAGPTGYCETMDPFDSAVR